MLKISKHTLESFRTRQNSDFRKRAIAYVYNEGVVKSDVDIDTLNKVLQFTEEYCSDAIILAEQSRLTMFVLGIRHGRDMFYSEEAKFLTDTRIPERTKVRKFMKIGESGLQVNA